MLKKILIRNYRCLKNDVVVNFENGLTLIVGENDAGKTTLVDALKVILQGKKVEAADFSYGTNEILFEIEFGEHVYSSIHKIEDSIISSSLFLKLPHDRLNELKVQITGDFIETEENIKKIKELANLLGVTFRSNTQFGTLISNVSNKIDSLLEGPNPAEFETTLPKINAYFLDGKHFEDISLLINELYFKEKKKSIWNETVNDSDTIESVIRNRLDRHASEIQEAINDGGITGKIQEFLPGLTRINVEPVFETRDLTISVLVKMLEGEQEILISKKGDGTKRRITLALLDYNNTGDPTIPHLFILDEADTHLHVKAQLELIITLNRFISDGKQIIVTTHSPFLINSCRPEQIRLLRNSRNESQVKYLNKEEDVISLFKNLGIENMYLFFAKKIVIVEGETEEKFIPIMFDKLFGSNLYSNLIKVINAKGINNVPGFARAILELINRENIFTLIDNDADEMTQELIEKLNLNQTNKFHVGSKEFEDSFAPNTIYEAWKSYVESCGRQIGDLWHEELIAQKRDECIRNGKKFSKELRELNSGSKKMDKITLGVALGKYCKEEDLDMNLRNLLYALYE